jgi:hypothetical protein
MGAKADRPPTLAALRREAVRVYGPGPCVRSYRSIGTRTAWAQAYGAGDPTLSVDVYTETLSDARRALLAALRALPDYEKGKNDGK